MAINIGGRLHLGKITLEEAILEIELLAGDPAQKEWEPQAVPVQGNTWLP